MTLTTLFFLGKKENGPALAKRCTCYTMCSRCDGYWALMRNASVQFHLSARCSKELGSQRRPLDLAYAKERSNRRALSRVACACQVIVRLLLFHLQNVWRLWCRFVYSKCSIQGAYTHKKTPTKYVSVIRQRLIDNSPLKTWAISFQLLSTIWSFRSYSLRMVTLGESEKACVSTSHLKTLTLRKLSLSHRLPFTPRAPLRSVYCII